MNIVSYDEILKSCLDRIPDDIDKSEGSLIRTALVPACFEISRVYHEMSNIYDLIYIDSSYGEYLDKISNQFGIIRKKATSSIRKLMTFDEEKNTIDIPINSRFFDGTLFYKIDKIIDTGIYHVSCESVGRISNLYFGELSPVQYIKDLDSAIISDIIVPGEDEETDESLKRRVKVKLSGSSFAGNISDYKDKVLSIDGVGGVRIYPHFNGGGTVKIVFVDSDLNSPDDSFVYKIKEIIDPVEYSSKGYGLAPIGHSVSVFGAKDKNISVCVDLVYEDGFDFESLKTHIVEQINSYFNEVKKNFTETNSLVIRTSHIELRLLSLEGILDINNLLLNSQNKNIILQDDFIPVLLEVSSL